VDVPLRIAFVFLVILAIATVAIAASSVLVTLCAGLLNTGECPDCEFALLQSPDNPLTYLILVLLVIFVIEFSVYLLGVLGTLLAYGAFRKPASELRSSLGASISTLVIVRVFAVLLPLSLGIGLIVAGTTGTAFAGSLAAPIPAGGDSSGSANDAAGTGPAPPPAREQVFIFLAAFLSWSVFIASALVLWLPLLALLLRGVAALAVSPLGLSCSVAAKCGRHLCQHGRCMGRGEAAAACRRSAREWEPNSWPLFMAAAVGWTANVLCCGRLTASAPTPRSGAAAENAGKEAPSSQQQPAPAPANAAAVGCRRYCAPFFVYPSILPHPDIAEAWHGMMDVSSFPRDDAEFPPRVLAHRDSVQRVRDLIAKSATPAALFLMRRAASYSTHYALVFAAGLAAADASPAAVGVCLFVGFVGLFKALCVWWVSCRSGGAYHASLEARVALHLPLTGHEGVMQEAALSEAFAPLPSFRGGPRGAREARNRLLSRWTKLAFKMAAWIGGGAMAATFAVLLILLLGAAPPLGGIFMVLFLLYIGNSSLPHPAGTGCCATLVKLAFALLVGAAMFLSSTYGGRFKALPLTAFGAPAVAQPLPAAYPACSLSINGLSVLDHCFLSAAIYRNDSAFLADAGAWFAPANITLTPLLLVGPGTNLSLPTSGLRFAILQQQPAAGDVDALPRVHVIVRGSVDAMDWLQDFQIWSEALFIKAFSFVGPYDVWPVGVKRAVARGTEALTSALNPRRVADITAEPGVSGAPSRIYMKYIAQAVAGVMAANANATGGANGTAHAGEALASISGHSLGGGLASIIGQMLGLPAVSFSGPGTWITAGPLGLPDPPQPQLEFVVVPELDPVPRADDHVGTVAAIKCRSSDPGSCHSIERTCCELLHSCGDPYGRTLTSCATRYGYDVNRQGTLPT
jgi:hypothetical protein